MTIKPANQTKDGYNVYQLCDGDTVITTAYGPSALFVLAAAACYYNKHGRWPDTNTLQDLTC